MQNLERHIERLEIGSEKEIKDPQEKEYKERKQTDRTVKWRLANDPSPEAGLEAGLESDHGKNADPDQDSLTRKKRTAEINDLERANDIRREMGIPIQNQENEKENEIADDAEEISKRKEATMLSEEEKKFAIDKFVEEWREKGHDARPEHIKIPENPDDLENFINIFPQYFRPERLAQVAMHSHEYATKLSRELALRGDIKQLFDILYHYRNKSTFEYCVERVENILSIEDLNLLVREMERRSASDPKKIDGFEKSMKKEKKTARPLEDYENILQIDGASLESLSGEELLLVGGGFSPIKKQLKEKGVESKVANIDPMTEEDGNIADETIKGDFFEEPVRESAYKEVWALHSLPTYAFNPRQVIDFYAKAIHSLKDGGVLRVSPVDKFSDSFSPAMRLNRKIVNKASVDVINILRQRPDLFSVDNLKTEHKGFFGKKSEMLGVSIRTIGDKDKINSFLLEAGIDRKWKK